MAFRIPAVGHILDSLSIQAEEAMNSRQWRVFYSIQDTENLLKSAKFDRPEIVPLRNKLRTANKALRDLHQRQVNDAYTGESHAIKGLRANIRKPLLRISKHAAAVLEGMPGIEDDVRVPHANVKHAELLEETRRIVKNVQPHLGTLYETGLPKTIFAQLDRAVRALETKLSDTDTALARRSAATNAIPDAIRRARKIVAALDSVVRAEFDEDGNTLLLWKSATRIPGRIGRPKKRRGGPKAS